MKTLSNQFVIRKLSNVPLFLADRNKTKKRWWTYLPREAFIFVSKEAAKKKCASLKYGRCEVISVTTMNALRIEANNRHERDTDKSHGMNYDDAGDSEYWDSKDADWYR